MHTFTEAIVLFDEYVASFSSSRSQDVTFNVDLAAEVQERLRQLDFIVEKVRALDLADADHHRQFAIELWKNVELPEGVGVSAPRETSPEMARLLVAKQAHVVDLTREVRLLTEAFYYFAFRIRQILTHASKPLPGLTGFECVEVRDVRNHLIEHPEQDSKLYAQSVVYGQPAGPALKTGTPGRVDERFRDGGLFVNANAFQKALVRILRRAVDQRNVVPSA